MIRVNLHSVRKSAVVLSLVVLATGFGYKLGQNDVKLSWNKLPDITVINKEAPTHREVDFTLFWEVWSRLEKDYVDKSKIDAKQMVYGAISGMVAALGDPYTVFLPPQKNKESKDNLNGTFEGIGAQLGVKDGRIVVVAPLSGMPAEAAGVKAGDWIVKVDGKETASWSLPEAVDKIRGPKGSSVTLTIVHLGGNKPLDISIVRNTILVNSVDWSIKDSTASGQLTSVLYLRLAQFGERTDADWDKAIAEMQQAQSTQSGRIKGLVLDLRNNPGGYLNDAVYTASEFLDNGVVVTQQNGDGTSQEYKVERQGKLLTIPMVVLVNRGSASAAEILAGALQSRKRAKLVGEQSFGKGSVQEAEDLPNGAGLHITISKWLLPNGEWINGKGLTPDDKISQNDQDPLSDLQLDEAVRLLSKNK